MSDNMRKVTLEFDVCDLPMLAHAMAIARNTALMCSAPKAKARAEEIRQQFEALIPEAARVFDDGFGFSWSEIGQALLTHEGDDVSVAVEPPDWRKDRWWDEKGYIVVRVGAKSWKSEDNRHPVGGDAVKAVAALVEELRPLAPASGMRP
jgi:hypothetical protein